jgi:hypothetical protein
MMRSMFRLFIPKFKVKNALGMRAEERTKKYINNKVWAGQIFSFLFNPKALKKVRMTKPVTCNS